MSHKNEEGQDLKGGVGVMGCGGGQLGLELERGLLQASGASGCVEEEARRTDSAVCFRVSGLRNGLSRLHSTKDEHVRTWALRMKLGWEATGRNAVWREG